MCSLFGLISSSIVKYELDMLHSLAYLACFRGTHSTGVAKVSRQRNKYEVSHLKAAVNPVSFIESQEFDRFADVGFRTNVAFLGHSRHATYGTVSDENAHPFEIDHITGMHNGSIPGLVKNEKRDVTDSQIFFERVAKTGFQNALNSFNDGAYAFIWANTKTNCIYFYRNSQRPLHYMTGTGMLFAYASEMRQLLFFKSQHPNFSGATIHELPPDKLFYIRFGSHELKEVLRESEIVAEIDIKSGSFAPWYTRKSASESATVLLPPPQAKVSKTPDLVPISTLGYPYRQRVPENDTNQNTSVLHKFGYEGYQKRVFSIREARKILNNGCCYCETVPKISDKVFWLGVDEFICEECDNNPVVKQCAGQGNYGSYVRIQ